MVERLRLFRGINELNYSRAIYKKTWDQIIDSAKFDIEKESSLIIGNVIDYKKADGTTTVFSGRVIDKKQITMWDVDLLSNGYELNNIALLNVYENTTPEAIVTDIINNKTINLTYASTEVSGITITKYVAKGYLIDIIKDMMFITGWQLRIDESDNVYFEPRGNVDNGRVLTNGTDFQIENWEDDNTDMFNHVKVVGGLTNVKHDQETFSGDDNETDFTLDKKPVGDIEVKIGGALKTAGIDGTNDYEVDHEQKKIKFVAAPTTGSSNITVDYNHQIRVVVDDQDDDSINKYGEIFKEYQSPATDNFADARALAVGLLSEFSKPKLKPLGFIPELDFDLDVGEIVTVVDSIRSITESVIIYSIKYDTQGNRTFIETGRKKIDLMDSLEEIKERIKKLERRTVDDETTAFSRISKHDVRVKLSVLETQQFQNMNDSFIMNHQTLGRLRTNINYEADCSDQSHPGTWQGTGIDGSQYNLLGWGLSTGNFNGSDNFIQVTDHADLDLSGDFSITIAVRVETLPGTLTYLLNKWDGTDGYAVRINASNKVELIYSNSGSDSTITADTALTAKAFQHVVFVKSGTDLTVYVNGSSDNTGTGDAAAGTNNNNLEIGRYSTNYFTGFLDEVRLYSDNISSANVTSIFNRTDNVLTNCKCWITMDNPKLGDRRGGRVGLDTNALVEIFSREDFKGSPVTADWNTTNRRLAMSSSSNQMKAYNTVATSGAYSLVNVGRRSFATITLTAEETKFGSDQIIYQVSTDNINWQLASLTNAVTLSSIDNIVYWRVIFIGNGANATYIKNLKMAYTLV